MDIWSKMISALKGGASEVSESIVDSQALQILDSEVRGASDDINQTRKALAEIIAKQKVAQRNAKRLREQVQEHEGYAAQALDKGNETLALEVAEKVASLENDLDFELRAIEELNQSADNLRTVIAQTERHLKRLKQQLDTVKATENVQRAQMAIAERHSDASGRLRTATDSLERIRKKQNEDAALMQASLELAEEADTDPLRRKLEEAGIVTKPNDADTVLARIKAKKHAE